MTIDPLPRRTLLQTGAALAGPLALAGLWPRVGEAAPVATRDVAAPLSGTIAGWVIADMDRGVTIRLVQLDAASRPVREVATETMPLGASLQRLGEQAHAMALDRVARSWGVPASECDVGRGAIAHAGQRRKVGYALWIDVV